ncbi:MAG: YfdX family protein [Chthoniobacterales bacterium]|nr:YfdX family protein [Chthoniobacterales bacterium]
MADESKKPEPPKAEPKSEGAKAVNPEVQSEVEKKAAEKRAQLLKDAQAALEETQKAVEALDQGKKDDALAALERVTGKLDLIVARDPKLALAPIGVATIVRDLYSTPEVAKEAVKTAKSYLGDGKVQQARALLGALASEEEVQVSNLPLATYPAAIKAIAPLIDAGKMEEAKTALHIALNTIVVESYIIPLPKVRAKAMLGEAEKLSEKSGRNADENKKLHELVEDARHELHLGEVLGYGTKDDYKVLYGQLDDIQKKTEAGKSGQGFFDKIKESLKNFKERIAG